MYNPILIVDDENDILDFYKKLFSPNNQNEFDILESTVKKKKGISNITFSSPIELLSDYKKMFDEGNKSPVCILDMRMPMMSGLEAAKKLREIDPLIKIIICTAYSDATIETIQTELDNDVFYVRKPFAPDEFVLLVQSLVNGWQNLQLLIKRDEELRLSEEKQRLTLSLIPDILFFIDKDGVFLDCQQSKFEKLFLPKESFIGKNLNEIMPHSISENGMIAINKALTTDTIETFEYDLDFPEGKSFFEIRILKYDDNKVLGLVRNITERKDAEKALRLSLANEAGGVGVWDLDLETNKFTWDNSMFDIYGIPAEEHKDILHNDWLSKFLTNKDIERLNHEIQLAIKGEKEFNMEFNISHPKGEIHSVKSKATIIRNIDGKASRLIGVNWDITESKKIEKNLQKAREHAEAANDAKSFFITNISHELRNPLNSVIGFSDLLNQTELTQTQSSYLNIVKQSAKSLLKIVNEILEFSNIESGDLKINPEKTDLIELVSKIAEVISPKAIENNLDFIIDIAPNVHDIITVDPFRLHQILLYLTDNAVKYTPQGEVTIKVEMIELDGDENEFTFSVIDSGRGIPPEKTKQIFELFSQADNSSTREFGGIGLGLATAKKIAAKMNTKIQLESMCGVGSKFSFNIKLPSFRNESPENINSKQLGHVLIIDDNNYSKQIIERILASQNINSDHATDCIVAMKMTSNKKYDLIIVDYTIPFMNGIQIIEEIKNDITNLNRNQPVILMINDVNETTKNKIKELKINKIISKPIFSRDLLNALSDLEETSEENILTEGDKSALNMENRKYTVLIVDDYPMNTLLAESYVNCIFPYAIIIIAKDGKEAVKAYKKHNPNIVIMDIQMPIMNGLEATIEIRKAEKKLDKHTPIIALTAGSTTGDRQKCLDAGMDDFMSKPVDFDLFKDMLYKHLESSKNTEPYLADLDKESLKHFDKNQLMTRVMNDINLFNQVLNMAIVTLPDNIKVIRKAYSQKYIEVVKFNAHFIKGIALDSSFSLLAEYASKLTELDENTDEENQSLINLIAEEFEIAKKVLNE